MVKNTHGGNKSKNKARKNVQHTTKKYEDLAPTEDQSYARITSVCGGGRFYVEMQDGVKKLGICCGKMKRGRRPKLNDLVCISHRDYQDNKCDILHLYAPDEVQTLLDHDSSLHSFCSVQNDEDTTITFANTEDSDEEKQVDFADL
jgi:translation initiation factor 1A